MKSSIAPNLPERWTVGNVHFTITRRDIGSAYYRDVDYAFLKYGGDRRIKHLEVHSRDLRDRLVATLDVLRKRELPKDPIDSIAPKGFESALFAVNRILPYLEKRNADSDAVLLALVRQTKDLLFQLPLQAVQVPRRVGKMVPLNERYRIPSDAKYIDELGEYDKKGLINQYAPDLAGQDTSNIELAFGFDYMLDLKARKPMGVRGPEGLIWGAEPDDLGQIQLMSSVATAGSQTMTDDYAAVDEAGNSVPYKVSAFPELLDPVASNEEPEALAQLQHTISPSELPDTLIVEDPDGRTDPDSFVFTGDGFHELLGKIAPMPERITYRRVNPFSIGVPWVEPPPSAKPDATLQIRQDERLGSGNSGSVYRAIIEFGNPEPQSNEVPEPFPRRKYTVAAKIPFYSSRCSDFVLNEAKTYHLLPACLSQDWSGYQIIPNDYNPYPAVAVVPKSYGYYMTNSRNAEQDPYMPILLIEECGLPISSQVRDLPRGQRELILSLVRRLHLSGFVQNSMATRNILCQPGPLHRPKKERSAKSPSFRIIDFGRATNFNEEKRDDINDKWQELVQAGSMLEVPIV